MNWGTLARLSTGAGTALAVAKLLGWIKLSWLVILGFAVLPFILFLALCFCLILGIGVVTACCRIYQYLSDN